MAEREEPRRRRATTGLDPGTDPTEVIFRPNAPNLVPELLHPWVIGEAFRLWQDGPRREAIQRAATAIEGRLKTKLGVHGVSLGDLCKSAFSTDDPSANDPRLRLPGLVKGTPEWTSAHEGARHFGMGCSMAPRNPTTHRLDEPDEQVAIEALAALSLLARWIEDAVVDRV